MNLKDVYDFSHGFLVEQANGYVSKQKVDEFISNPDKKELTSLADAYELLLNILQDFNRYPNVIKFSERNDKIKSILDNYNLEYIASLQPEDLLAKFKTEFKFDKDAMWLRYTKGVISGAKFMCSFKDFNEFKSTFDSFNVNDMTREAFALFLSKKIDNMGFAIACNWLKELGYYQYAKPDTHTKDICDALGLAPKDDDLACFEAMVRVSKDAGVEAYKVDKVWWLICSGNFYRYNILLPNPGQRKEQFLSELKKRFTVK